MVSFNLVHSVQFDRQQSRFSWQHDRHWQTFISLIWRSISQCRVETRRHHRLTTTMGSVGRWPIIGPTDARRTVTISREAFERRAEMHEWRHTTRRVPADQPGSSARCHLAARLARPSGIEMCSMIRQRESCMHVYTIDDGLPICSIYIRPWKPALYRLAVSARNSKVVDTDFLWSERPLL